MTNKILGKPLSLSPSLSDLNSIKVLSTEDKALLLACRRYMASTNVLPHEFCKELFDLASQALDHSSEDFTAFFSQVNSADDNAFHTPCLTINS
ncbi:hypothetical protein IMCC1989_735 [gamma proteobacterium IMCC1989]|nr:hypothetical protein IMCC1989_735 [gamma proteobacterium IMCC1989]